MVVAVEPSERVTVKVKCPAFSFTEAGFGVIDQVSAMLVVTNDIHKIMPVKMINLRAGDP